MSDRGVTPLFYALCDNNCDMVTLLVESATWLDVGMQGENEVSDRGVTPLFYAVCDNNYDMVTLLLESAARLDVGGRERIK